VDRLQTTTYPSFAHLLSVWIAIADRVGGDRAIFLLAPMFAATAWWAIGLLALEQGGTASAIATVALLSSWLPEHWFGRFLMPEILAQALLFCGVALAASALSLTEGAIAGACLGVAAFARLEQLTIFVPALLLARAFLPSARRLLPRGALLPLSLAVVHATLHLAIIPTDYGKRIARLALDWFGWTWSALGGSPQRVGAKVALVVTLLTLCGIALYRRRRMLLTRVVAALVGGVLFLSILVGQLPKELPALHWLAWYVPLPAWAAVVSGILPPAMPSGMGLALAIEALDQITSPRVTMEQIWAARRLVTVVLPLFALAAGWAIARVDRPRSSLRTGIGTLLVAAAIVQGARRLSLVMGHPLQANGAAFAREVGASIPRGSTVIVAASLDWLHLAPSLWLESNLNPIVARRKEGFVPALDEYLSHHASGEIFVLAGAVATDGGAFDPTAFGASLPPGYTLELVRTFSWSGDYLERSEDRPPATLVKHRAELALLRARRSGTPVHE
jgi:hypothetical protein